MYENIWGLVKFVYIVLLSIKKTTAMIHVRLIVGSRYIYLKADSIYTLHFMGMQNMR